jgi:hypothetical protein
VDFVHPRNRRCLPPGQNPLKGEPKPPVCYPGIRESARNSNTGVRPEKSKSGVKAVPVYIALEVNSLQ